MKEFEREISRRSFLRDTAVAGGGLIIGAHLILPFKRAMAADRGAAVVEFNAWIQITNAGKVRFVLDKAEMGQGVMTTLATIVGEELDVDPHQMEIYFAPPGVQYGNPKLFFTQITGGSTSVAGSFDPLRRAAAAVRYALVRAAAKNLGARPENVSIENSRLVDHASGKSVPFSGIVTAAGKIADGLGIEDSKIQPKIRLKSELGGAPAPNYKYIGKPMTRLDARKKCTGEARFGIDVDEVESAGVRRKVLTCVLVRCPVPGGKLKSFSPKEVTGYGIHNVVTLRNAVGVVAESYYEALKASRQLKPVWDLGQAAAWSTDRISKDYHDALYKKGILVSKHPVLKLETEIAHETERAPGKIEAIYETPYLPHSTMEPMNCTAWVQDDLCEIWVPTQAPAAAREVARQITGLPLEKIGVHTTFLGGGFGRRIYQDFVAEAVQVSKWCKAPVKVIWSREDDFKHDYYRPAAVHRIEGALAADGTISHWMHRTASQSIFSYITNVFLESWALDIVPASAIEFMGKTLGKFFQHHFGKLGVADPTSVEGMVTDATAPTSLDTLPYRCKIPYAISNFALEYTPKEPGIPVGFWRSVGHSHTAFAVESFVDELAHSAGKDPYQFRVDLMKKKGDTRHLKVLQLAAEKAGWSSPPLPGRTRGIAVHDSFGTYVAHVVEVSIQDKQVQVHRVVSAVDCGFVLNPDMIEAQIQGGILFGLSATLKQEITIRNGEAEQSRFDQCDPIRMFEAPPHIEVHIVPSDEMPTGIGEPGVPPVAPAVCNAIFAATGVRVRKLPVRL